MSYTVLICPVCLEQVEWDAEYGSACFHDEYGNVEAVEVSAEADQAQLTSRSGLALFRLQDERRQIAFREAERRWFSNLPAEEQARIKAERRAAMSPLERTFEDYMEGVIADTRRRINEPAFSWASAVIEETND